MKKTFYLFTDAAVSPQNNLAIAAFLCLDQEDLEKLAEESQEQLAQKLANLFHFQELVSKKSTYVEIMSAIHGLSYLQGKSNFKVDVEIFTDCQSLCDLLGARKEKLLAQNFITRTGKILANASLYQDLFKLAENFNIVAHKLKGHAPESHRIHVCEKIFALLDKEVRNKLRTNQIKQA